MTVPILLGPSRSYALCSLIARVRAQGTYKDMYDDIVNVPQKAYEKVFTPIVSNSALALLAMAN